jgi:flagellar basal body rod protein FlgB
MTESQRLELIANAVANASAQVAPELQKIFEELKEEKLAEDLVLEHGLLEASEKEVEEEFVSLDAVESDKEDDDFDNDENLVDMDSVSESMREIFGE